MFKCIEMHLYLFQHRNKGTIPAMLLADLQLIVQLNHSKQRHKLTKVIFCEGNSNIK